jgi:hypothetical protein
LNSAANCTGSIPEPGYDPMINHQCAKQEPEPAPRKPAAAL